MPDVKKAPLCGNSIATDRGFLALQMPELDSWLHYRMVDVSSVKELARRWYPRAYFASPEKNGGHRALADIKESIEELRYYRATVFVPQPGPDTETAAKVAAAIVAARSSEEPGTDARPVTRYTCSAPTRPARSQNMVGVAQLVEHRVVVPGVAGSSPVAHPTSISIESPWSRTGQGPSAVPGHL